MKPFLQGKRTLDCVPLHSALPPPPAATSRPSRPGASGPSGPSVEVVRQGDKVTRLIVLCSCGERIEIDCLYSAGS